VERRTAPKAGQTARQMDRKEKSKLDRTSKEDKKGEKADNRTKRPVGDCQPQGLCVGAGKDCAYAKFHDPTPGAVADRGERDMANQKEGRAGRVDTSGEGGGGTAETKGGWKIAKGTRSGCLRGEWGPNTEKKKKANERAWGPALLKKTDPPVHAGKVRGRQRRHHARWRISGNDQGFK